MKKHFKLILAALCALVLFATSAPILNAAENDSSQSGGNEQLYKYTIRIHVVDWAERFDGGTQTITVVSKTPLYIYKHRTDEPATYLRFFNGDFVDFENAVSSGYQAGHTFLSDLKDVSLSYLWTFANGETEMQNRIGGSAIEYQGKVRMTVSATCPIFTDEESLGNSLKTGSTDGWENYNPDKDWTFSGSISATDSILPNTEDQSYSFCSDGRLAILHDNEYEYYLYTGTGSDIYQVTNDGLKKFASASNEQSFYNLFPMTRYNHYESTIPIFRDREKLLNYIETGSLEGYEFPTEDNALPYLQNVAWNNVGDCYGGMPYIMGDEISWKVDDFPWKDTGQVELYADIDVTARGHSLSLTHFNMAFNSADFERAGISLVNFSEGRIIIPDDKYEAHIQEKLDEQYGKGNFTYETHKVIHFYVRLIWRNEEQGKVLRGNFVRITPGGSIDDFGRVETGKVGEIKDGFFTFETDTESEGSYEYNKDYSGNYPFDDSNISDIPTSLDGALNSFVDIIGALIKGVGKVPSLVAKVFSFLPNIFFVLIGGSFTVVVILRILGR